MHYRLLVTLPKKEAKNSEEARQGAYNHLENENFASEGGRFTASPSDWFVIGGRWSGELQEAMSRIDLYKLVEKKYKDNEGVSEHGFSMGFIKDNAVGIQKLWEENGGKDTNPLNRDGYNHNGYEDDGMLLTKKLYDKLLKEYEGEIDWIGYNGEVMKDKDGKVMKIQNGSDGEHKINSYQYAWLDTDYRDLSKKLIGDSWIVVVDYHN